MAKDCGPPSKVPQVQEHIKAKMGESADAVAEKVILADYIEKEHIPETAKIPGRAADGTQLFVDKRGVNTGELIKFLKDNHGSDAEVLKALSNLKDGGIQNPDWMIFKTSPPAAFEYYEVKPKSASGRKDGVEKLRNIKVLLGTIHLPQYEAGRFYEPRNREQELFRIDTPQEEIVVSITWSLSTEPERANGLLVYEICADTRQKRQPPKFPPPIVVSTRPNKSDKARRQQEQQQLTLAETIVMMAMFAGIFVYKLVN